MRKMGLEEWSALYNRPRAFIGTTTNRRVYDFSKLAGVANANIANKLTVRSDNTRTNVKARAIANNRQKHTTVKLPANPRKFDLSNHKPQVNDYLTTSNDATSVANGKQQNLHLRNRAIQGANSYAAWAKANSALNKFGMLFGAAPFIVPLAASTWNVFPYLSNSYLLGQAGGYLAGNTGSAVGGAIGNAADLGLSGLGVYNGVKTLTDKNADDFDKTLGVVNGVLNTIPLWNTGRMAFRSSFANNVFPAAYNNNRQQLYTKGEQAKRTFAETFKKVATLRANRPVSEYPYWMTRLDPRKFDNMNQTLASGREHFRYRQDAINMAMKQPVYNDTYIRNADGTYSYNPNAFTQPEFLEIIKGFNETTNKLIAEKMSPIYLLNTMKEGEHITVGDNLVGNAGYAGLIKENGKLYMVDDWDVQPFKDEYRLPSFRGANFLHNVWPKMEIIKLSGGKPFTLKHQIKTD